MFAKKETPHPTANARPRTSALSAVTAASVTGIGTQPFTAKPAKSGAIAPQNRGWAGARYALTARTVALAERPQTSRQINLSELAEIAEAPPTQSASVAAFAICACTTTNKVT
jgi:hypothetical protein